MCIAAMRMSATSLAIVATQRLVGIAAVGIGAAVIHPVIPACTVRLGHFAIGTASMIRRRREIIIFVEAVTARIMSMLMTTRRIGIVVGEPNEKNLKARNGIKGKQGKGISHLHHLLWSY